MRLKTYHLTEDQRLTNIAVFSGPIDGQGF